MYRLVSDSKLKAWRLWCLYMRASVGSVAAVEADACRPCAGRGGVVQTHPLPRVSSACLYKSEITPYGSVETSFNSGGYCTILYPLRWAKADGWTLFSMVALDAEILTDLCVWCVCGYDPKACVRWTHAVWVVHPKIKISWSHFFKS